MEGLENGCKSGIIRCCQKLAQFVNGSCLVECVKKKNYKTMQKEHKQI